MSGKPETKPATESKSTVPAVASPAPAAVSILGEKTVAPSPSAWQKFTSCLTSCFVATKPIIDAAIKLGMDAASSALREKIESDSSLTSAQKEALTGVTASSLEAIKKGVLAQVAVQAQANAGAANPALNGLVDAAISSGVVDAFVPELGLKASSVTANGTAVPKFPITTVAKVQAAVTKLKQGNTSAVLDLSAATGALVLQDKAVQKMVEAAIVASDLPEANKKVLLKTGAALKFVLSTFDEHNEGVAKAQLASLAKAVPVVHEAEAHAVVDLAGVQPVLDAAGVGLAGAALDVDAVAGHA